MKRAPLLIVLSLFAMLAFAAEPQPDGTSAADCAKTEPAVTPAKTTHVKPSGPALPARASAPVRQTPRWNSLLPGMFR